MGILLFKRFIAIFSVVFLISATGIISYSCSCGKDKKAAGDISVPITVQNSKNIGSVDIVFKYDPGVLEITDVLPGKLSENSMMEYNAENPGRVNIGIVDTDGISGDGDLVIIGFDVVDKTGTSQLELEAVKTHDATSLIDVINKTTDGSYKAEGNSLKEPAIIFSD